MLPDNLPDRPQFLGGAEVGTHPPHDRAVSADNRTETGLPAADDDVIRGESLISFIEPMVRSDISRRVDVQPVKTAPRVVHARSGLNRVPCVAGSAEVVDTVARHPFPQDHTLWRNLDEPVIFEFRARNIRPRAIRVRQNQRIAAFDGRLKCRRIVAGWKILPLPVMVLARGPYGFSVVRCDLLRAVKPPYEIAFEVSLDKLERFLVRRARSVGGHDNAIGKDTRWTAGGIHIAVPSLNNVPVHVDDDHRLRSQW